MIAGVVYGAHLSLALLSAGLLRRGSLLGSGFLLGGSSFLLGGSSFLLRGSLLLGRGDLLANNLLRGSLLLGRSSLLANNLLGGGGLLGRSSLLANNLLGSSSLLLLLGSHLLGGLLLSLLGDLLGGLLLGLFLLLSLLLLLGLLGNSLLSLLHGFLGLRNVSVGVSVESVGDNSTSLDTSLFKPILILFHLESSAPRCRTTSANEAGTITYLHSESNEVVLELNLGMGTLQVLFDSSNGDALWVLKRLQSLTDVLGIGNLLFLLSLFSHISSIITKIKQQ